MSIVAILALASASLLPLALTLRSSAPTRPALLVCAVDGGQRPRGAARGEAAGGRSGRSGRGRGRSGGGRRGGSGRGARGRGDGGRGGVPRLGQLETAAEVLAAHREHGRNFRPADLASSWNVLGRLARRRSERQWLAGAGERLAPLHEQTLHALPAFQPRALANTAHGMATIETKTRWRAGPRMWRELAEGSEEGVGEFNPQGLANTAWAYATAGHAAPALLEAIAAEAAGRVGEFNPQDLAITAWAYAVLDVRADALFGGSSFAQLCEQLDFSQLQQCQLHQWQLWRDEHGPDWPPLPPALAARCREAFVAEPGTPSRLQSEVADALRAMGLPVREEVRTRLGYSLDAVVTLDGREVGVEVDGPSHFAGRTPTGATALKRRQLRAAGWALVSVPYWEWNNLARGGPRVAYLRQRTSRALAGELVE